MTSFERDMARGKIGEEIVLNFLKSDDRVKKVVDVREDELHQLKDIDFIQFFKNGKSIDIEVKTDELAHKTDNIAYESISSKTYGTLGCFDKTSAQLIYYYIAHTDEILIIDVYLIRAYMKINKDKYKLIDMGDDAMGYLIPIKDILNNGLGRYAEKERRAVC